ncbi:MAG: sigma-54 dependent transcriptional regulator [Betaproteobacteria bacterium]|nr:sigma-54 dependent transcriptional regulator [Betaproteobacteria bacterium]
MNDAPLVCLVEDDPIMGESLRHRLELEGFRYDWHTCAQDALACIGQKPYAVVVSDIRLPDLGGDELFGRLLESGRPLPPFIFITGFGSVDRAVQLLKMGAADYITKPFDIEQLVEKVRALARPQPAAGSGNGAGLGVSQAMRRIEEILPRLAKRATTLLITGESGVGKERVAVEFNRLARESERCPFIAVNCGAITESLFEAELFGHEKGAFTGATRTKKGFFEQAHCGTLFLDEVGELPLSMQVKLLRAIQERRVTRVGGETSIAVELRLVCATNRDLKKLVEEGRFREDLYYRVNVIQLHIPALRERKEDILSLARVLLDEVSAQHGGTRRVLSGRAEQALLDYPWPGNVRELRHCIERACIVCANDVLEPEDFFEGGSAALSVGNASGNLSSYLQECERGYITRALIDHGWQIQQTAESLRISRKSLWEKMKKLEIRAG